MVVIHVPTVREVPLPLPAIQFPIQRLRVLAKQGERAIRRRRALKKLDRELEKGNYKAAMSLVKQVKAHPAGLLRGFGVASPKIMNYRSLKELKLMMGGTEISSLQLVVDAILSSIKRSLEFQLQEEETMVSVEDFEPELDVDSIHEDHLKCMHVRGSFSNQIIEYCSQKKSSRSETLVDIRNTRNHEAGHFLVGYMLGVLPRRFKIPSVEDLSQDRLARGKVEFVGFEFLRDVGDISMSNKTLSEGKLSKETLKKFSCVILGGMTAEHLMFGYSDLLHSDVQKLVTVFKWMGFTEKEVDSKARWAAEAAVLMLCDQSDARSRLAEAMALGKSVGSCFETIERAIQLHDKS